MLKKGDTVTVLILNVDAENKRISLGLKQAEEDPWLRIGETYPVGTQMRGRVVRLMDKGVVIDLGNDIEGFIPMSQLGIPDIQDPAEAVKEGQAVEVSVLEVDPIHHRIVLAATGFPKASGGQVILSPCCFRQPIRASGSRFRSHVNSRQTRGTPAPSRRVGAGRRSEADRSAA
jgi:small subunit ribosomal protein S1